MGPLVAVPLAWPVVEAVLREDLASRPLVVSAVLVVNERTRTSHKPMGSRSDPVRDGLGIVPVRDRHSGPSNCVLPAPFCCQPVGRSVLFAGPGSG